MEKYIITNLLKTQTVKEELKVKNMEEALELAKNKAIEQNSTLLFSENKKGKENHLAIVTSESRLITV